MISSPIDVELPTDFDAANAASVRAAEDSNQERLKRAGDWVVFPQTLEYIADGRYAEDDAGGLYVDGQLIPKGLSLVASSLEKHKTAQGSEI